MLNRQPSQVTDDSGGSNPSSVVSFLLGKERREEHEKHFSGVCRIERTSAFRANIKTVLNELREQREALYRSETLDMGHDNLLISIAKRTGLTIAILKLEKYLD